MKKKTTTVAFANLIGSLIFIIIGVWAWVQTTGFKTVKNTQVQPAAFPQIMIIGMLFFSVILLIQSIWNLSHLKEGSAAAEKSASLNFLKDKGFQAAFLVIALCIAYVALF